MDSSTGYHHSAARHRGPSALSQKFTGKERDAETGLDYFGARYFSGAQGRFTSVDPSMASVTLLSPQSWNRYTYAMNNPLRYVDPNGELWVASGDANNPYKWVDTCDSTQTCYEKIAVAVGGELVVYGSENERDVTGHNVNRAGVIDLAELAANHDTAFVVRDGTRNRERFATPEAAAALFNATADYASRYPRDDLLVITASSLATGRGGPSHLQSHGRPNAAIDFRYINAEGIALRGRTAAGDADPARMGALFNALRAAGFNQTVSGRPADFGTGPVDVNSRRGREIIQGHQNHGHAGIVERLRPPRR